MPVNTGNAGATGCVHMYKYTRMCTHVYARVYIDIYVCVYVCIYVYIGV